MKFQETSAFFEFPNDLNGFSYTEFMTELFACSKYFCFVERNDCFGTKNAKEGFIARTVKDFVGSCSHSNEWPGTILYDQHVKIPIHKFETSPELLQETLNWSSSIFSWEAPKLPEDIFFLDHEEAVIFYSISHEEYALLDPDILSPELERKLIASGSMIKKTAEFYENLEDYTKTSD